MALGSESPLEKSQLGKKTSYAANYDPTLLFSIAREIKRIDIGLGSQALPFHGIDLWNHFELSWLNEKGKPVVAIATFIFGANSPFLIESKSLKLYCNSLNNTKFKDTQTVLLTIKNDLEKATQSPVVVTITPLSQPVTNSIRNSLEGYCIDDLDIECSHYNVEPCYLKTREEIVEETLTSNLLRSNCLVTGQPDWGSLQIAYVGKQIDHENLLKYIVSFRNHIEFGEHCAERIFMDILNHCQPSSLSVIARYTRRGGIDINCYRSTSLLDVSTLCNERLLRQ